MLRIKRIEIEGFKSFHKRAVLELRGSFVALTGGNGSGKSNIIDAVLFTLGENNTKLLRVSNLRGLLYDGGGSGVPARRARAAVQFDNSGREVPIDSDTVTIAREMDYNGRSIYRVNGKRVSRHTIIGLVHAFLAHPEAFSIVPQGATTRISEMRAEERRALIENLIGIPQYDEKKELALKLLSEVDLRLHVLLARMQEVVTNLRKLEEERNSLMRYRKLEEEIATLRALKASRELAVLEERLRSAEQEVDALKSELEEKVAKRDALLEAIEKETGELGELKVQHSAIYEKYMKLHTRMNSIGGEEDRVREGIERARARASEIKGEKAVLTEKMDFLLSEIRGSKEKLISNRILRGELSQKLESIGTEIRGLEGDLKALDERILREEREDKRREEKVSLILRKIEKYKLKIERARSVCEGKRARLCCLELSYSAALKNLSQAKESLSALETSLTSGRGLAEDFGGDFAELAEKRRALLEALYGVERILETLTRVGVKSVLREGWSLRLLDSVAKVVVPGYLGTVGSALKCGVESGGADERALGPWLDTFVVEDDSAASRLLALAEKFRVQELSVIVLQNLRINQRTPSQEGGLGEVTDAKPRLDDLRSLLLSNVVTTEGSGVPFSQRGILRSLIGDGGRAPCELPIVSFKTAGEKAESGGVGGGLTLGELGNTFSYMRELVSESRKLLAALDERALSLLEEKVESARLIGELEADLRNLRRAVRGYETLVESLKDKIEGLRKEAETSESRLKLLEEKISSLVKKKNALTDLLNRSRVKALEKRKQGIVDHIRRLKELEEQILRQIGGLNSEDGSIFGRLRGDLAPSLRGVVERLRTLEREEKSTLLKAEELSRALRSLGEEREEVEGGLGSVEENLIRYQKSMNEKDESLKRKFQSRSAVESEIQRLLFEIERKKLWISEIRKEMDSKREVARNVETCEAEYSETIEEILPLLEQEMKELSRAINFNSEEDYRKALEVYRSFSLKRGVIEEERGAVISFIDRVEREKRGVFVKVLDRVNRELRATFKWLTGGEAWLEPEDGNDPSKGGLLLIVSMPDKRPREASSLSGGEKTLAAIALLLAMQSVYKSPFYLFDEIDAHLDSFNQSRLLDLLKIKSSESQFLIITLKYSSLSKFEEIHGVYNQMGSSRIVRLNPEVIMEKVAGRS